MQMSLLQVVAADCSALPAARTQNKPLFPLDAPELKCRPVPPAPASVAEVYHASLAFAPKDMLLPSVMPTICDGVLGAASEAAPVAQE